MTEILHIGVFIDRTHTDMQGHLNTKQPHPGRGNYNDYTIYKQVFRESQILQSPRQYVYK